MHILISDKEFNTKKSRDDIPLNCLKCNQVFYRKKHHIQIKLKNNSKKKFEYCSINCSPMNQQRNRQTLNCKMCNISVIRPQSKFKKSKNIFCSQSCAAKYNNANKSHGTRRSKLEKYIESQLVLLYSNLEIHFNRKDTIKSELDIYLPTLKLAFELNGIFHYKPIYGSEKLSQIKNNDTRKFQACLEHGIELCIIDSSQLKYFKNKNADKYLKLITSVIDEKLSIVLE